MDAFVNPTSANTLANSTPSPEQHANLNDAVAALQAKIGVNGSAVTTSLDYLLKNSASVDPGHKHTVAALNDFPSQTGHSGKYLTTNGSALSWGTVTAPTWGAITGTLADQADLQAALDAKTSGSGTSGHIAYWFGASSLTGEFARFWDTNNNKLGRRATTATARSAADMHRCNIDSGDEPAESTARTL